MSSSCAPTALTNAIQHELSRARVASISSRSTPLPTWNGEADRFADDVCAREREIGGGRPGADVLAHGRTDERLAAANEHEPRPGWK